MTKPGFLGSGLYNAQHELQQHTAQLLTMRGAWDLDEYAAHTANIDVIGISSVNATVATIESLKVGKIISTILLPLPAECFSFEQYKNVIDRLVDLLKINRSIRNLRIGRWCSVNRQAKAYLLNALATGDAGDNVEYLWFYGRVSENEAGQIERYLGRNRNLTRLYMGVANCLELLRLAPSISVSSVQELCFHVESGGGLRELGAALGQYGSILTLSRSFLQMLTKNTTLPNKSRPSFRALRRCRG